MVALAVDHATDLPESRFKIVGSLGGVSLYDKFERPFWSKHIGERSQGRVTAEIVPFTDMGLGGSEIVRLIRVGVIDFGSTALRYVSGTEAEAG